MYTDFCQKVFFFILYPKQTCCVRVLLHIATALLNSFFRIPFVIYIVIAVKNDHHEIYRFFLPFEKSILPLKSYFYQIIEIISVLLFRTSVCEIVRIPNRF